MKHRLLAVTAATAILAGAVGAHAPQAAAADALVAPTKERAPFMVDVRVSTGPYIPAGASGVTPAVKFPTSDTEEIRTLIVKLTNVSGKPQERVKIEYGLYKLDVSGEVREMARKGERLSFKVMEQKFVTLQGTLQGPRDDRGFANTMVQEEKFYGWFVRLFVDGAEVYEKYNPVSLKEIVKKSR